MVMRLTISCAMST